MLNIHLSNMNRFTYLLRKWTRRRTILEQYVVDGHEVSIVDEHYLFNIYPEMRIMEGKTGWYSAIYKDPKRIAQPMYPEIQSVIERWNKRNHATRYLILGCAGCSLLRFIGMKYADSQVTGVEISEAMIQMAKKYFLEGFEHKNIELVHDDAFLFLKRQSNNIDVCVVDLFDNNRIIESIYEDSFIYDLSKVTRSPSIVIFNFFGQSEEQGMVLCELAKRYFDNASLLPLKDAYLPFFVKGDNSFEK